MQTTAFDPRFARLLEPGATFEAMPSGADVAGGDFRFRGCDGGVWVPELDALVFNDVGHARVLSWTPGGDVRVLRRGSMQAGQARDADGSFVACEVAAGRIVRWGTDGTVTVVADGYGGGRFAAPAAVTVGPDGSVYFTVPQRVFPPRASLGTDLVEGAGVYRVAPGSSTVDRLACDEVATPGGLALSADGGQLYVSDEQSRRVLAYRLLPDGRVGAARGYVPMAGEQASTPHGLCLDGEGHVYVGGPGGVWVFAPDGQALGVIGVAATWINAVVFGGAGGDVLFVLTSTGVGALRMRAAAPMSPVCAASRPTSRGEPLTYAQSVERMNPALDRIVPVGARVRNLRQAGFEDDLGGGAAESYGRSLEGTFWDAEQRCLFFSDIANDRRLRFDPVTDDMTVTQQPTGYVNGATLDTEGRVVQAEQGPARCISRIEPDGSRTVLIDRIDGKRLNRPNDVVVRSDGSIFFTNPWWTFGDGEALELDGSNVVHLWPDLTTVSIVATDFVVPNGLTFSPDEKTFYVNESQDAPKHGKHIRAYDVRPDGSIDGGSGRVWFRFPPEEPGVRDGAPDGMKVDQAGNLYCGGPGGLWVFDEDATHLGTIVHGDAQTNNLCFGGEDGKTLFFVSWVGLHAIDLLVAGVPLPPAAPR